MQAKDTTKGSGAAIWRALILTVLIVVIPFFWIVVLFFTDLSLLVLAVIALLCLLLLSVATAWTAIAFPSRSDKPPNNQE